jgi:hypothetical protein
MRSGLVPLPVMSKYTGLVSGDKNFSFFAPSIGMGYDESVILSHQSHAISMPIERTLEGLKLSPLENTCAQCTDNLNVLTELSSSNLFKIRVPLCPQMIDYHNWKYAYFIEKKVTMIRSLVPWGRWHTSSADMWVGSLILIFGSTFTQIFNKL